MDKEALDVTNIKDVMDLGAAAILDLPADERAGWVIYLLETVDGACQERGHGCEFSDSVVTVFLALSHRLADGAW